MKLALGRFFRTWRKLLARGSRRRGRGAWLSFTAVVAARSLVAAGGRRPCREPRGTLFLSSGYCAQQLLWRWAARPTRPTRPARLLRRARRAGGGAPRLVGPHVARATGWQPMGSGSPRVFWHWSHLRHVGGRAAQWLGGRYAALLRRHLGGRVGLQLRRLQPVSRREGAWARLQLRRWRTSHLWAAPRRLLGLALLAVLLGLRTCSAQGVARAVRLLLTTQSYGRHRPLLYFLQRYLRGALPLLQLGTGPRGVYLQLRGKVGRRGLARRSKSTVRGGDVRPQQPAARLIWEYVQVHTITGALGLNGAVVF